MKHRTAEGVLAEAFKLIEGYEIESHLRKSSRLVTLTKL